MHGVDQRQALAQFHLQSFHEPALRHVQNQQHGDDDQKYSELDHEVMQVATRQCVKERLIPAVEAQLAVGGGDHDQAHPRRQQQQLLAHRRIPQRQRLCLDKGRGPRHRS